MGKHDKHLPKPYLNKALVLKDMTPGDVRDLAARQGEGNKRNAKDARDDRSGAKK